MLNAGEKIATRDAYGKALLKLGRVNPDVVALDCDLSGSTRSGYFKKEFPSRFFNMGIAEQDMMATAAGLAACGNIPFASSFAVFATGRAYDQIRTSIAYPRLNVKIAGSHAGITVGADGATHEAIDDLALMRVIPNMVVINPADAIEMEQAVFAAADYAGPVYIRLGRMPVPVIHHSEYHFEIGKGELVHDGEDVAIIATGSMVWTALEAAEKLERENHISALVMNIHTLKPLDDELISWAARKTGRVVTIEEHSVIGGLGSAVCETLSRHAPVKVKVMGIQDRFGQSGEANELLQHYKLTAEDLIQNVLSF